MVEKLALYMIIISLPMALTISIFASDLTTPLFGLDFGADSRYFEYLDLVYDDHDDRQCLLASAC